MLSSFGAMDSTFIVLMIAVCLCGCYRKNVNWPAPFQGNLALAIKERKHSSKPDLSYYTRAYGNIPDGNDTEYTIIQYDGYFIH